MILLVETVPLNVWHVIVVFIQLKQKVITVVAEVKHTQMKKRNSEPGCTEYSPKD